MAESVLRPEVALPPKAWDWDHSPMLYSNVSSRVSDARRICDVGCGDGRLLSRLIRDYPQKKFVGVDLCEPYSAFETKKHYAMGAVESLPFRNESFDAVLCTFVLDYLSDANRYRAMSEILRVLKDDGRAILALHNRHSGVIEKAEGDGDHERAAILRERAFGTGGHFMEFFEDAQMRVGGTWKVDLRELGGRDGSQLCYLATIEKMPFTQEVKYD